MNHESFVLNKGQVFPLYAIVQLCGHYLLRDEWSKEMQTEKRVVHFLHGTILVG
jgi:hypothetical protein